MSTDDTRATSRPEAAGRREDRDGAPHVVIERTFRAPVTDVWAAVTEPARLERWIGTWAGDPPRRLVLSWMSGATGGRWHVELDLVEADGVTTLTFAQRVPDTATWRDVGPGWEYYLDRLTAAESDGDVAAVAWPDYEGMAGHYERLFADLG